MKTLPTYKAVLEALKLDPNAPTYGIALDRQGLANLAYWSQEKGLPAITGLVVLKDEQIPGSGFFKMYGKDSLDDLPWWLEQIRVVKQYDWDNLAY